MRMSATLGLLFLMGLGAPAFGQSFVGKWTATAGTPGAGSTETLTVTKVAKGFAVAGKTIPAPAQGMEAGPGVDIVLNGDRFSYKRTLTIPGGIIVISYSGVVAGDKFTGMAEMNGAKVPYSGVRVKDKG